MEHTQITSEAKARLFDTLTKHGSVLVEAIYRLAEVKAEAAATAITSGLKIGGQPFSARDFGLTDLSAAYEVLTGEALDVDAMIRKIRNALPAKKFACHLDVDEGGAPESCVLDAGRSGACVHAKRHGSTARDHCGAWRPVAGPTSLVPSPDDVEQTAAM